MRGLHRFVVSMLTTISAIAVSHAQVPAGEEEEASASDPDIAATEEFVREAREAAQAARQGLNEAPPEQVDELIAGIEAETETSDSNISLQERVWTQTALVGGLRERYTEHHPTVVRATQRLEQLETQLEEEEAARSDAE
jgi:uncharacterized protein involved in exopolysaccharide biosynthesis